MLRHLFAAAATFAVIASATFPSRARADLVIPPDFTVLNQYSLQRCEPFALTDLSQFTVTVWVTACVGGSLDFGLNTDTGLYGAAYDFTTTITGTPPFGWVVGARMCDFGFDGYWPSTGSHTYSVVGSYACFGGTLPLTSGIAYSPIWFSGSQLVETSAYFAAYVPFPSAFTSDDRWGGLTVTTTPEPSTFVLLSAGLVVLATAGCFRRRNGGEAST